MVQVIKKDHVAAGLCCIQLFMNSSSQEEAIKHLENAKVCTWLLFWNTSLIEISNEACLQNITGFSQL